jgi:hypothetical protein
VCCGGLQRHQDDAVGAALLDQEVAVPGRAPVAGDAGWAPREASAGSECLGFGGREGAAIAALRPASETLVRHRPTPSRPPAVAGMDSDGLMDQQNEALTYSG